MPGGCCNLWEPDLVYGDKPSSFFDTKVHVKSHNRSEQITSRIPTELSRGIADIRLSPKGAADVDQLGRDLARIDGIDVIYTSPLWRTKATARAIQLHIPDAQIVLVDNLLTWDYGNMEGQPASRTGPVLLRYARKGNIETPGTGPISGSSGESFDDWKSKILKGFRKLMLVVEQYPQLVIAIVTSSRDIYTLEGWFEAGMPRSLDISFKPMTGEDHPPGKVAKLVKKPGGMWTTAWLDLQAADADLGRGKPEALLIRHGSTPFNEGAQ